MIASMVVAIGVSAILSVVTTGRQQLVHADIKQQMNEQARRVLEDLKAYSRPATCPWDSATCSSNAPSGSWAIPGDSKTGCWALDASAPCNPHDMTSTLPTRLRTARLNAQLKYNVTVVNSNRVVKIDMTWNED